MSLTPRPSTMARSTSIKLTLSGGVLDCTPEILGVCLRVIVGYKKLVVMVFACVRNNRGNTMIE